MKELTLEEMKNVNGGINPAGCMGAALVFVGSGAIVVYGGPLAWPLLLANSSVFIGSAMAVYANCW